MRNSPVTDADLTARAAAGDGDAFGELVDRHAPQARRAARLVLGNEQDADDAAQDGFLAAWRAIDRYDRARPFRPWLMRIVVNAARDLRRRQAVRRTDELSPTLAAGGPSPERETDRSLLRDRLAAALAALPERQRLAVTMFDAEGYAHSEIADVLGIPEGTVRSDVFHARRALRSTLAPYLEETR
jgi:RNA polymerase sigma-70 factor (ECF subfamily)